MLEEPHRLMFCLTAVVPCLCRGCSPLLLLLLPLSLDVMVTKALSVLVCALLACRLPRLRHAAG